MNDAFVLSMILQRRWRMVPSCPPPAFQPSPSVPHSHPRLPHPPSFVPLYVMQLWRMRSTRDPFLTEHSPPSLSTLLSPTQNHRVFPEQRHWRQAELHFFKADIARNKESHCQIKAPCKTRNFLQVFLPPSGSISSAPCSNSSLCASLCLRLAMRHRMKPSMV